MGDSDFEFDDGTPQGPPGGRAAGRAAVQNQPHDEEFVVDDDSSPEVSPAARQPVHTQPAREVPAGGRMPSMQGYEPTPERFRRPAAGEDEESSDDDFIEKGASAAAAYNPAEFAHMDVPPEVAEVFEFIARFKPSTFPIEPRLRPFIPDYIPAIGDIDEFIKVPRPDGKPDLLGLRVLDEPAAQQSDASVLKMQLRSLSKSPSSQDMQVASIENAEKAPQRLQEWIRQAAVMTAARPAEKVAYSRAMPDTEALMEQWAPELEAVLDTAQLGGATLDAADLPSLIRIYCALLDIPVHGENLVEPLHQMMSLYLEFKANPYLGRSTASAGDPFRKTSSPAFGVSRPGSREDAMTWR